MLCLRRWDTWWMAFLSFSAASKRRKRKNSNLQIKWHDSKSSLVLKSRRRAAMHVVWGVVDKSHTSSRGETWHKHNYRALCSGGVLSRISYSRVVCLLEPFLVKLPYVDSHRQTHCSHVIALYIESYGHTQRSILPFSTLSCKRQWCISTHMVCEVMDYVTWYYFRQNTRVQRTTDDNGCWIETTIISHG